MTVALFFLLYVGQSPVCVVQYDNALVADNGNSRIRFEPYSVAFYRDCRYNTISSLSYFTTSENEDIRLISIATVFANITKDGQYMIAVQNNSLLNAKFSVYVVAHKNITVNGYRMITNEIREWSAPFPTTLSITYNDTVHYIIKLRQISSLDDIDDSDRPTNATAEYNMFHLAGVTIGGAVSGLASLLFCIVVLVFIKSQRVHEGLPNEL